MRAMFRSLSNVNYRIWFLGALVSNVGTWMQRTAQDWLVLTKLTDQDAAAVGLVMALQFAPALLLMPLTGLAADRFDRRHLLMVTQASMGLMGLGLGILTVTGWVELWHVYLFALLLGIAAAFDAPARQTFVSDLVEGRNLQNAVALNATSFNAARLIGPAVAGLLTAVVGEGWVFLINSVTFAATIGGLKLIRPDRLFHSPRAVRARGQIRQGFRYIVGRPDIVVILVIVFLIGTFGLNFPIYTSTMASVEFHRGAADFGLLSSTMAVGSVVGALLSARRDRPRMSIVFFAALAFGLTCLISALMPGFWIFAASLALIGVASQTLMTTANATVQLTTDPIMRGRVMSVYMAIFVGGTPLGAPIVGWVANELGPRWGLGVGAASGILAFGVAVAWLLSSRRVRIRYDSEARLRFRIKRGLPVSARSELSADEGAATRA